MRVSCVSGCGGSVVVKLPDEIDELDGYDAEKVQERKEVRKYNLLFISAQEPRIAVNAYPCRCQISRRIREAVE